MDGTAAAATTKAKRAPRSRKGVAAAEPAPSIAAILGGAPAVETPPTLFVEEVAIETAPVPVAKKPKKAAAGTKKPTVVAVVSPDGIQGSLSGVVERRPLIAHLPIHTTDIENDLFTATPASDERAPGSSGGEPKPYDAEDVYAKFGGGGSSEPVAAPPPAAIQTHVTPATSARPSLPLHYSERLMIRFQDANRDQRLPENTDVACFWDCHTFRGTPCVIPTKIEEDIWHVYGNFCSPECAATFLFNERLDTHVQWERYALLNRLYAEGDSSVRLAAPRSVLRLFGGTLDVTEYRAVLTDRRMRIDVMSPPMISITQVMDTKPIDFYDASVKNNFIPWEMDRMNRPGAQGLRLRRTKPVMEKEATLEWCMGIKASA
jgi:hypothetical protein